MGVLVAVGVERLVKVALMVEQADADEGQAHIAGPLAVVAGKDSEAAGVDRQALMEAELGAEIGDQVVALEPLAVDVGHVGQFVVAAVGRDHAIQRADEDRILGGGFEALLVGSLEKRLGVVVGRLPQAPRQLREQRARRAIPTVPEVAGEIFERSETDGNLGIYFEFEYGSGHDGLCWVVSWS